MPGGRGLGGHRGPRLLCLCLLAGLLGVAFAAGGMTVLFSVYHVFHIGTILKLLQGPDR
jgi:hypothetical protein